MRRFFYTLKQAFLQVLRNRAMSVASIFAITAMLLILSIFFILVINVNTAAQTIQQDYDSIEIYLKDDVTKEQANDIITKAKKQPWRISATDGEIMHICWTASMKTRCLIP